MIKQWKGKQRVTPCAWTLPILHHIPLFGLSLLLFSLPFSFSSSSFLVFLFRKERGKGERRRERIDKEECHFLRALFCLSIFFVHLSSILFLALPIKIVFLLSLLSPSLSLLFSCSPSNDKNTRKEEQEGNGGHVPFFSNGWGK